MVFNEESMAPHFHLLWMKTLKNITFQLIFRKEVKNKANRLEIF